MNCSFCNIPFGRSNSVAFECVECLSYYRKSSSGVVLARLYVCLNSKIYYVYFNQTSYGHFTEFYSASTGSLLLIDYKMDLTPTSAKRYIERILKLQVFK